MQWLNYVKLYEDCQLSLINTGQNGTEDNRNLASEIFSELYRYKNILKKTSVQKITVGKCC